MSRYETPMRFVFVDADVSPVRPERFPRETGYFVR